MSLNRMDPNGVSTEPPPHHQVLSQILSDILEDSGASNETRKMWKEMSITEEIIVSLISRDRRISWFVFGSSFEGSTTPGMRSDLDVVYALDFLPVAVDRLDAQRYPLCFLMVQDPDTPPGYVKLQTSVCGQTVPGTPRAISGPGSPEIFDIDKVGRQVFTVGAIGNFFSRFAEQHGPAFTTHREANTRLSDYVLALRCQTWPPCAAEWFTRQRNYDWPSSALIEQCSRQGCFFVRIGHPNSEEAHLEWRISFSLQERLLISHFSSVQFKCFVLLKLIKKDIVQKILEEESITSYHCKTCMLYMMENTPPDFWTENNLLLCLQHCLMLILKWTETGICPNYFLPAENMFDRRVHGELRIKLEQLLRNLLSSDFKFLIHLRSDQIGKSLQNSLVTDFQSSVNRGFAIYTTFGIDFKASLMVKTCMKILRYKKSVLRHFTSLRTDSVVKRLHALKHKIQSTDSVNEHTRGQTQRAANFILPYIELSLMSNLVIYSRQLHKEDEVIFRALKSERWHEISLKSDMFSAKLKQASLLYMLGYYTDALDLLLPLEDIVRGGCVSLCERSSINLLLQEQVSVFNVQTTEELLLQYLIPCVEFLPAERDLTPPGLYCEILESSSGLVIEWDRQRYDLMVVDGKVFLHYLLYLTHFGLGATASAKTDLQNLERTVESEHLLCHKKTALNILGCIFWEQGYSQKALACFQQSARMAFTNNVACRNIQELI